MTKRGYQIGFVGGRRAAVLALVVGLQGCSAAHGLGQGMLSPLDDLNLRRTAVPPVLIDAAQDPYGPRNLRRCSTIAAEVALLDDALGPDLDEPPAPADGGHEAGYALASLGAGLLIDSATDFVPVRDWVRVLSGAERHSRQVQAAVHAGRVRRAFLKGMGIERNCAPPAAPSWFRPRVERDEARRDPPPERRPDGWAPWVRPPWARY